MRKVLLMIFIGTLQIWPSISKASGMSEDAAKIIYGFIGNTTSVLVLRNYMSRGRMTAGRKAVVDADLDGDGEPEVAFIEKVAAYKGRLVVLKNTAKGYSKQWEWKVDTDFVYYFQAKDLNKDGRLELLLFTFSGLSVGGGYCWVFRWNGTIYERLLDEFSFFDGFKDMNHDGIDEIIFSFKGGTKRIYIWTGTKYIFIDLPK